MEFIFTKRGYSPETEQILQPKRTTFFGKVLDNQRVHDYRPRQHGRKQIERLNVLVYNRLRIDRDHAIAGISTKKHRIMNTQHIRCCETRQMCNNRATEVLPTRK